VKLGFITGFILRFTFFLYCNFATALNLRLHTSCLPFIILIFANFNFFYLVFFLNFSLEASEDAVKEDFVVEALSPVTSPPTTLLPVSSEKDIFSNCEKCRADGIYCDADMAGDFFVACSYCPEKLRINFDAFKNNCASLLATHINSNGHASNRSQERMHHYYAPVLQHAYSTELYEDPKFAQLCLGFRPNPSAPDAKLIMDTILNLPDSAKSFAFYDPRQIDLRPRSISSSSSSSSSVEAPTLQSQGALFSKEL
jgi:hypothetical protein